MIKNAWIVGQLWISYADILYNDVTGEIISEGVRHMYSIIKPYIIPKSNRKIEERLIKNYPGNRREMSGNDKN